MLTLPMLSEQASDSLPGKTAFIKLRLRNFWGVRGWSSLSPSSLRPLKERNVHKSMLIALLIEQPQASEEEGYENICLPEQVSL